MTRQLAPAPPLVAAVAALALLSCGGEADKKSPTAAAPAYDVATLGRQETGPNPAARSGRIDGRLEITLKGVPEFAEPFTATISGPFRYRRGSALPDYEIEMGVRDYGVELSSVGGRSYVSLGTTGFELPAAIRSRLKRSAARARNGLMKTLEQFGVAPWRWETDKRIAGTTRVDGVEVVHMTTSFNAGRQLRDANTLLGLMSSLGITRAVGLPRRIAAPARRTFVGTVRSKVAGSWIGVKDKVRRKSGFTMKFAVPKADRARLGGITGGTVVGQLLVTEVGKPQRISAPESLGRFADFQLALDAVGDQQEAEHGR